MLDEESACSHEFPVEHPGTVRPRSLASGVQTWTNGQFDFRPRRYEASSFSAPSDEGTSGEDRWFWGEERKQAAHSRR